MALRLCSLLRFRIWSSVFLSVLYQNGLCSNPLLLVISFDGFHYKYLDLLDLPNLHSLATNGVRAQWMVNTFISKTLPNHYTMETGLYQESHGIVANRMYDPEFNETFEIKDIDLGKNVSKWYDNGLAFPIWVANQLQHTSRHSGMIMWPGTGIKLRNQFPFYIMRYNDSTPWHEKMDTAVLWFKNSPDQANCIFMYFNEPDKTGHRYGPHSLELKKTLLKIDDIMGYLIQKLKDAGIFNEVNLMLVSDHGMCEIRQENVIDLNKFVNPSWYSAHGDSPVWSLWPADGKTDILYEKLVEASNFSNFTVYKREDIPERYHYKNHRRVLPIVVVADEGWEFDSAGRWPPKTRAVWGNHGYDNRLRSMHPFFIARGPEFKMNYTCKPIEMVDLYPLMSYILKLPIRPSNGSLSRIWHILKWQPRMEFTTAWLTGALGNFVYQLMALFSN